MLMNSRGELSRNTAGELATPADDRLLSIDFHEMWAAVYRSRLAIAVITGVCLLIGVIITLMSTPIYRATATVQIDQEAAKVLGTEQSETSASLQDAERFLKTQLDIIRSRGLATTVAEDLRLFDGDRFLEAMGEDPDVQPSATMTAEQAKREVVIAILRENLAIDLPRDSRVASIQFSSPDPLMATKVANSYVESFIRSNLQRKFDTSTYAREFLGNQLKEAQARLEQSERAAVNFASRTRIIDISNGVDAENGQASNPKSLVTATLVQLNQNHASALSKRLAAQQQWERARNTPLMNLPEVLANPAIQQMVQQRAEFQATYEEELARRKRDFPTVRQAAAKVSELDQQIRSLASSILGSIRTQFEIAQSQEDAIKSQVDTLKSSTLREQNQSIQLSILRRESDTNRQQFDALLRRYNQLNAEAGVQSNNISIVDLATTPSDPTWPKVSLNMALAILAALSLSGLYVLGRENFFGTIRTPEDVTDRLHLPLLGAIPDSESDVAQELRDPKAEVAEAFNSVRTALTLSSKSGLPRTLAFVSTQMGEGKSTVCYATAVSLARVGKRVVVLDLDLRRPNQHKLHEVQNGAGISSVLTGEHQVDEVIRVTTLANVSLITSGPIPPNPTELLTNHKLAEIINELHRSFDVVLIDSPPVLGLADAVIIGAIADGIVYIIESGRNNPKSITSALKRLQQGDVEIIGVVLSRFDPDREGYGYSYNYAYHYQYAQSR